MAQSWTRLRTDRFLHLAHRLYRNYDGRGSSITGRFVRLAHELGGPRELRREVRGAALRRAREQEPRHGVLGAPAAAGGTVRLTTYQLAESLNLRLLERARPTTPPSTCSRSPLFGDARRDRVRRLNLAPASGAGASFKKARQRPNSSRATGGPRARRTGGAFSIEKWSPQSSIGTARY